MVVLLAPQTIDVLLITQLENGLEPLELSILTYDLLNLYNIGLFSTSLEQTPRNRLSTENDRIMRVQIDSKYLDLPSKLIYRLNLYLSENLSTLSEEDITSSIQYFKKEYRVDLKRINYNSPGSLDLLGIGKVIEVIKDFIIKWKELRFEKQKYADNLKKAESISQRDAQSFELTAQEIAHKKRMADLEYKEKFLEIQNKEIDTLKKLLTIDNDIISENVELRKSIRNSGNRIIELMFQGKVKNIILKEDIDSSSR